MAIGTAKPDTITSVPVSVATTIHRYVLVISEASETIDSMVHSTGTFTPTSGALPAET